MKSLLASIVAVTEATVLCGERLRELPVAECCVVKCQINLLGIIRLLGIPMRDNIIFPLKGHKDQAARSLRKWLIAESHGSGEGFTVSKDSNHLHQ